MRRFLLLPLVVLALACDSPLMTDPLTDSASVRANVSAPQPVTRPLKVTAQFAPDLTAGLCTVAVPGVGDLSVAAKLGGPGNMSHLGRVTFEATVDCATFAVGTNSSGAVWLLIDGPGKWTAANGDYFTVTYLGTISLVPIPGIIAFGPITIDGGSGRFEDATGNASGSGTIDFATGSGVFSIEGWITYGAYNRSNR